MSTHATYLRYGVGFRDGVVCIPQITIKTTRTVEEIESLLDSIEKDMPLFVAALVLLPEVTLTGDNLVKVREVSTLAADSLTETGRDEVLRDIERSAP